MLRKYSRSQSDTESSQDVLEDRQALEEEIQQIMRDQNKSIIKLRQDSIKELTDLSPLTEEANSPSLSLQPSLEWDRNSTYPRRYKRKPQRKQAKNKTGNASEPQNYPLDKSQSHDTCILQLNNALSSAGSNPIRNYKDHLYQNTMDICKPQRPILKGHQVKQIDIAKEEGFSYQKYYAMHKAGSSVKTFHQRLRLGSYSADDILSAKEEDHSKNNSNGKQEGLKIIHKPWSSLDNTTHKENSSLDFGDYVSLTSVESLGSQKKPILSSGTYAKKMVNWDSSSFNSSEDSPFTSCDIPTTAAAAEKPLASSSPKILYPLPASETFNVHSNLVKERSRRSDVRATEYVNFPPKGDPLMNDATVEQDYDIPKSLRLVSVEEVSLPAHGWTSTPKRPDSLSIKKNLSLKGIPTLKPINTEFKRYGSLKERLHKPSHIKDSVSCESGPQLTSGLKLSNSVKLKGSPSYQGWTRMETSPTKAVKEFQALTPQNVPYQGWARGNSEKKAHTPQKDPMFEFHAPQTEQPKCHLDRDDACSSCKRNLGQKCYFCRHKLNKLSRRVSDPNLRLSTKYKQLKVLSQGEKDALSSEEEYAAKASCYQMAHKRSQSYDYVHSSRLGIGLQESFRKQIAERALMERPKYARQNINDRLRDREEDFEYVNPAEDDTEMQAREGKLQQLRQDLAELTNIEEEMKAHKIARPSLKANKTAMSDKYNSGNVTEMNQHSLFSNESRRSSTKDKRRKSGESSVMQTGQNLQNQDSSASSSSMFSMKKMRNCAVM